MKANIINDKKQYLMAPLVLLHKTPDDNLMPIAIQVRLTLIISHQNELNLNIQLNVSLTSKKMQVCQETENQKAGYNINCKIMFNRMKHVTQVEQSQL